MDLSVCDAMRETFESSSVTQSFSAYSEVALRLRQRVIKCENCNTLLDILTEFIFLRLLNLKKQIS